LNLFESKTDEIELCFASVVSCFMLIGSHSCDRLRKYWSVMICATRLNIYSIYIYIYIYLTLHCGITYIYIYRQTQLIKYKSQINGDEKNGDERKRDLKIN